MRKFLYLLVGVILLSKTNGTPMSIKPSLISEDTDDEFSVDDWNELDVIYPGDPYSEGMLVPEKRASRDSLMRRSTLDKNFMRFGRSGFFPGERCCRQKDLVGLAESYASISDPISVTKRETDSNFIRFGRGSGTDNFMRFGKGGDNFMRFGRPEKDKGNFMRFGRGGSDSFMRFGKAGDNFMRFGRPEKDKGNFMRFSRDDKGNFMRFGKDDKGNFMRFGRGRDDNFMRFGRGDKDNFIRFGRGDDAGHNPDETADDENDDTFTRSAKSDNFMRFGKNPINFIRYGKSGGKDDSFIRFGKSGRNGTNFLRFGREMGDDSDGDDGAKTNLTTRRKRESHYDRIARSPELMEDVLPDTKRSAIEENVAKPNLLKFISLINRNHPNWVGDDTKSFFPPAQRNPALTPNTETYKRKQDGSGFIRFG